MNKHKSMGGKRSNSRTKRNLAKPSSAKVKPFINLPKPSFKQFDQLYQLIKKRLGEEKNKSDLMRP